MQRTLLSDSYAGFIRKGSAHQALQNINLTAMHYLAVTDKVLPLNVKSIEVARNNGGGTEHDVASKLGKKQKVSKQVRRTQ